ncbi:MAG: universal stress protein [Gordonia sp. (in: high G+C Gram-positive bacteria)]
MTILASFSASRQASAPVELAVQIARTTGEPIVVAAVVERRMPKSVDPIEDEYIDFVTVRAERALHGAVDVLPESTGVTVETVQARSIPDGLMAAAGSHDASIVTLGSSSSGLLGRIALGSVTERLVHTARVPVAIAPRGYRPGSVPVTRLTVAYGGHADNNGLIKAAGEMAEQWGVPLRIASFVVRDLSPQATSIAVDVREGEDIVLGAWWKKTRESIDQQLEQARDSVKTLADVAVGTGPDWSSAVDSIPWLPGELMLVGSGAAGPRQQVFLGSAAGRILRASSVPVIIMPKAD